MKPSPPPATDFATNLGPKILVVAGGLAVVIFVGLFVRYAWENNWVGPLGRVLSAAVFSSGLAAGGLRLMERRYRPLGQGLTAAGLAGLYVTAWAAHEVYGLVSREVAGGLLVVVALAAVAIALRRDARLLAGLASVGGYLAPVLVSTGEDHAEILFTYLLLLGAGAAWLERKKPWPEALLFGAVGTLLLYGAWYESHFTAHRFGVAAIGLVLLSALYAFGKPRTDGASPFLAGVAVLASGLVADGLAGAPERPWGPLALLAVLAQMALLAAGRWRWTPPLGAAIAAFAVQSWFEHFAATSGDLRALALGLGVAAAYIVPLTVSGMRSHAIGVPGALAHVFASLLALSTLNRVLADRPGPLFLATLALAALHLLLGLAVRGRDFDPLRARVTLGLAAVFLTVAIPVWFGLHATTLAWAAEGLLLLWLGVRQRSWLARGFGYAVLLLAVGRLFARHAPLHPDGFTPVLNPVFGTWLAVIVSLAVARRLARGLPEAEGAVWLDDRFARLLGPLALALLLGLLTAETRSWFDFRAQAARDAGDFAGARQVASWGGLAVTVLWALYATTLLHAGRRSPLARGSSYALLLLAVGRLFTYHVPLHPDAFTPVLNPAFATWMSVIVALGLARRQARLFPEPERTLGLEDISARLLGPLALVLLFGLLTAETQSLVRGARARGARRERQRSGAAGGAGGRRRGVGSLDLLRHGAAVGGDRSAQPAALLHRLRHLCAHGGQGGARRPRDAADLLPHALVPGSGSAAAGGRLAEPALPGTPGGAGGRIEAMRLHGARSLAAVATLAAASAVASPAVIPLTLPSGTVLQVEVMVKDEDRAMGLMFRSSLPRDRGMLFLFERPDFHGIWMKNCKFPIDIVWLDEERKVVHVAESVPPCKAEPCPVYSPLRRAAYVVEMNAGQARREKAALGSTLGFTLPDPAR